MSGGSWNYFYSSLDDVAELLMKEQNPLRIALGRKLKQAADALHDIEWVDSNDYGTGRDSEAIKKFLEDWSTADIVAQTKLAQIQKILETPDSHASSGEEEA
jgi:hypothetical protein